MSLNAQAIAVSGYGFGPQAIAVSGYFSTGAASVTIAITGVVGTGAVGNLSIIIPVEPYRYAPFIANMGKMMGR